MKFDERLHLRLDSKSQHVADLLWDQLVALKQYYTGNRVVLEPRLDHTQRKQLVIHESGLVYRACDFRQALMHCLLDPSWLPMFLRGEPNGDAFYGYQLAIRSVEQIAAVNLVHAAASDVVEKLLSWDIEQLRDSVIKELPVCHS